MNKLIIKELHKPVKRKFQRSKVVTKGIDDIWASDLIDLRNLSKQNKGYKYILTVIDCFSRYAWGIPLKDKLGSTVKDAFKQIFKERKPNKLWVDQGSEYINKNFKEWLDSQKIQTYHTYSEHKSSIAERFNRTLKSRIWRIFSENNNYKWIDELPNLVNDYNSSTHRTLKTTPIEASKSNNEIKILKHLYGKSTHDKKPKFKIGDYVRISLVKKTFEKGYTPNWSKEIFMIVGIKHGDPVTYELMDEQGENIEGSFYEEELQKTLANTIL